MTNKKEEAVKALALFNASSEYLKSKGQPVTAQTLTAFIKALGGNHDVEFLLEFTAFLVEGEAQARQTLIR